MTDFFNTIGRLLPVADGCKRPTAAGGGSQKRPKVASRDGLQPFGLRVKHAVSGEGR